MAPRCRSMCGTGDRGRRGARPDDQASVVPTDSYEGETMCRILVAASGVEPVSRCPLGPGDAGDSQLPGQAGCLRDSYVLTAIAYCWRSGCLARQGVTDADVEGGRAASTPAEESRGPGACSRTPAASASRRPATRPTPAPPPPSSLARNDCRSVVLRGVLRGRPACDGAPRTHLCPRERGEAWTGR